jgi:hypothetical protein
MARARYRLGSRGTQHVRFSAPRLVVFGLIDGGRR